MTRTILATCLLAILLAGSPALAFEPLSGTRAYPISGTDIVSGQHVDLDQYLGKWVLLEFWATW
ncbi:MAG: hypothetical protein H7A35_15640 [Planctomycetales bacterium]|nr:hypothetical protein [bacterium]UNM08262.1 MAG: hypothetical protein H7A35_15640 [Planctomycetales bacterium]